MYRPHREWANERNTNLFSILTTREEHRLNYQGTQLIKINSGKSKLKHMVILRGHKAETSQFSLTSHHCRYSGWFAQAVMQQCVLCLHCNFWWATIHCSSMYCILEPLTPCVALSTENSPYGSSLSIHPPMHFPYLLIPVQGHRELGPIQACDGCKAGRDPGQIHMV